MVIPAVPRNRCRKYSTVVTVPVGQLREGSTGLEGAIGKKLPLLLSSAGRTDATFRRKGKLPLFEPPRNVHTIDSEVSGNKLDLEN